MFSTNTIYNRSFQNALTIPPLTLTGTGGAANSGFLVTIDPATGNAVDQVVFPSTSGFTEASVGVNADGAIAIAVRVFVTFSRREGGVMSRNIDV